MRITDSDVNAAYFLDELFIVAALDQAATIFHSLDQSDIEIFGKDDPWDLVTTVDLEIESHLIRAITAAYPNDDIISEEAGLITSTGNACWVLDPLDGTSNFASGLPLCGTMMARLIDGVPRAAGMVVYPSNHVFSATSGHGARLDGMPLNVDSSTPSDSLVDFGIFRTDSRKVAICANEILDDLLVTTRGVRMTGSLGAFESVLRNQLGAAISLSFHLWDVVAPWLIFREAGGSVETLDFKSDTQFDVSVMNTERFAFVFSRFENADKFANRLRKVAAPTYRGI